MVIWLLQDTDSIAGQSLYKSVKSISRHRYRIEKKKTVQIDHKIGQ